MPRTILALVLLLPALARADAVDFDVLHKVLAGGRDRPAITVVANDDADGVEIRLQRDDGKVFAFRTGPLRAGQSKRFALEMPAGREHHFTGEMKARVGPDTRTATFDFDAEIVTPAEITFDKSKVDLAARTMELRSTRKTSRVEVAVTGDQGEDLGVTEVSLDNAPPGTPLRVSWTQGPGRVLKIVVRVIDPDDFYAGVELYPWRIDIPHEEVNFASGSFKIDPSEEPKLDHSLELIQEAVAKYGRFAEVKLFVAGHTDTVGAADANRVLSLNRARAICESLRRKGLKIPIRYEGFGEDALKVPTPDETPEILNRRVEYIVAIEPPPGPGRWKPLK